MANVWTINGDDWAVVKPVTTGILSRAELLLLNDDFSLSSPMWPDRSGNSHHGQLGSAAGSDTNDPVTLKKGSDGKYAWLPGTAGNFLWVPTSAALEVTGDIDVRVRVTVDSLTPSANTTLIGNLRADPTRSWRFDLQTSGKLRFYSTPDGTWASTVTTESNVALQNEGFSDGDTLWLRATRDVDNGSGGNDTTFYVSVDGVSWTQFGAVDTQAGTTSIYALPSELRLGENSGNQNLSGRLYEAQVYDGIDGTLALDVNLADATEPFATFTERANGATVTINRSASGYVSTVVDRGTRAFSTDDYVEVADHEDLDFAAGEDFTLIAVDRPSTMPASNNVVVSKSWNTGIATGYKIYRYATNLYGRIGDGAGYVSSDTIATEAAQELDVIALRRDTTADEVETFLNGVSLGAVEDTTTASLATGANLYVGAHHTPSGYGEGEIMAVALFREALTDAEIAAVSKILATNTADAQNLHGDALFVWMHQNAYFDSRELVGALNELNGTRGVEYRKARKVFLGQDY